MASRGRLDGASSVNSRQGELRVALHTVQIRETCHPTHAKTSCPAAFVCRPRTRPSLTPCPAALVCRLHARPSLVPCLGILVCTPHTRPSLTPHPHICVCHRAGNPRFVHERTSSRGSLDVVLDIVRTGPQHDRVYERDFVRHQWEHRVEVHPSLAFFSFSVDDSGMRIAAWRSDPLMHCKCASKLSQWSHSQRGITLPWGSGTLMNTFTCSPTPQLQRRR